MGRRPSGLDETTNQTKPNEEVRAGFSRHLEVASEFSPRREGGAAIAAVRDEQLAGRAVRQEI